MGMIGARSGRQTTLAARAAISGIGVHSGREVSITLHPAEADSGITFLRTNVYDDGGDCEIPGDFRYVSATDLCTTLAVDGTEVATIEHLMATFGALGIDNAIVELDGPEVPVMDGSAVDFTTAVDMAGIAPLGRPRHFLKIVKPVRVEVGESFAEFRPYDRMRVEVEIDFASPVIGRQHYAANIDADTFRNDLARARTFGFLSDVERLWSRGLALGASLDNAVVVGDDRVINPEGLRYDDEFVRHKALDAVGDLALIGAPILGMLPLLPRRPQAERVGRPRADRRRDGVAGGHRTGPPRRSPRRAGAGRGSGVRTQVVVGLSRAQRPTPGAQACASRRYPSGLCGPTPRTPAPAHGVCAAASASARRGDLPCGSGLLRGARPRRSAGRRCGPSWLRPLMRQRTVPNRI